MIHFRNTILLFCMILGFSHITNGQSPRDYDERRLTDRKIEALNEKFGRLLQTLTTQLTTQLEANTKAMQNMKESIERQNQAFNLELQKLITSRFATLPADLLNNDLIKARLEELKKQILEDIRQGVPTQTTSNNEN